MNTKAYVILFSLFLAACGGGNTESEVEKVDTTPVDVNVTVVDPGTDEPEAPEVPSYETHSTDISGVWTGVITFMGSVAVVAVTVHQAVSDSADNTSVGLVGTVNVDFGTTSPTVDVTGTKTADTWSLSGSSPNVALSAVQILSSDDNSSGTFSLTMGVPGTTENVNINLAKG